MRKTFLITVFLGKQGLGGLDVFNNDPVCGLIVSSRPVNPSQKYRKTVP